MGAEEEDVPPNVPEDSLLRAEFFQLRQEPPVTHPESVSTPPTNSGLDNEEISSTGESCGTYIARKWQHLVTPKRPVPVVKVPTHGRRLPIVLYWN